MFMTAKVRWPGGPVYGTTRTINKNGIMAVLKKAKQQGFITY